MYDYIIRKNLHTKTIAEKLIGQSKEIKGNWTGASLITLISVSA